MELHILKLFNSLINFMPTNRFNAKLKRKVDMKILYKEDIISWRIEKAKEMGVKIGNDCRVYSINFFSEPFLVEIGNKVIISGDVKFITHDGSYYLFKDREDGCVYGKIKIGNNCFLGMSSIILPNTIIGDNCIIGAGAVVKGEIPDNSVVMGNSGKIVFKTSIVQKMLVNSKFHVSHSWENEKKRKKAILDHFSRIK